MVITPPIGVITPVTVKPLIGVLGSMKKLVRDHLGTIAK